MPKSHSIALIGAGTWGKNYLRLLQELGVLGAVVDPSEERQKEIRTLYPQLPVYSSSIPVWKDQNITGVVIATPAATHAELAIQALVAGKDVLVEKPMAMTKEEAEKMVEYAQSLNRILMVGHILLYQPAILWIKDFLESGGLGRIQRVEQLRLNLGKARSQENVLLSLGIHDLAVLVFLLDQEPTQVHFSGMSFLTPGIEDDCHLFMKYPDNLCAHLHTSWYWYEKDRRLAIFGEKGILVFFEDKGEVYLHRKRFAPDLREKDEGVELLFSRKDEPLRREVEDFLQAIETRQCPRASCEHGLKVMNIVDKILKIQRRNLDGVAQRF